MALILDDEDALAEDRFRPDIRQGHSEGRALAVLALEHDRTAHLLDQPFRQRETESRALGLHPSLVETLEDTEDAIPRVVRDTDARIGDRNEQIRSVEQGSEVDASARRRELHRIRH